MKVCERVNATLQQQVQQLTERRMMLAAGLYEVAAQEESLATARRQTERDLAAVDGALQVLNGVNGELARQGVNNGTQTQEGSGNAGG